MSNEVKLIIEKYWEKVKEHRIWLHQHPESSGEEIETSAYVAKTLQSMGLEVQKNVGGYGVVALIRGKGPGKCIGLRADMDALQITEKTGCDFCSQNEGLMHACGHDTHTAMLLGAAYVLNELKDSFNGCAKLIFQPSEENAASSGAKKMIEAGVLEHPKVDMIVAQHVWPQAPVGKVLICDGPMMAASDRFFISIHGKSSHGSEPEDGVDAIVIAAQVITALQTIVSRVVGPRDSAVVTIGKISGGSRYNIIDDEVTMEGTCRNLNPKVRQEMPKHMESIIKGIVEGMGGRCEFNYVHGFSPTINCKDGFNLICNTVKEALGEGALEVPKQPALVAEDFSFFGEKIPSAYYWLGCHNDERPFYPLHNSSFLAEWEALPIGMEVMVNAALKYLKQ